LTYSQRGEFQKAAENIEKAISLYPWTPYYYNSLAGALLMLGKFELAQENAKEALRLNPNPASFNNKGMILMELGRHEEALQCYEQALKQSNEPYIHFNYAICLLMLGKWAKGFQEYEYRHALFANPIGCTAPTYLTSVYDQEVVLVHEQGFGDTIQFIRYAKLLKKYVKKLGIWCPPELEKLMTLIPEIDEVNVPKKYDCFIPMLSLPRLFDTTPENISESNGYIPSKKNQNKEFSIGIVWSSRRPPEYNCQFTQLADAVTMLPSARNMVHFSSYKRSFHPRLFEPISKIAKLFSLQQGPDVEQIKEGNFPITELKAKDFFDTACNINSLDLVISIDTAVAHLAGAMNKPTFLLLPFSSEWRWGFNKDITPWYSSMRIFKQPKSGDWESVFKSLTCCLESSRKQNL